MSSSAANRPADLEAQFKGETRTADGYQYWTTSEEDEEAIDFGDMAERAKLEPAPQKKQRKKLAPGVARRLFMRLATLLLLLILAALAYLIFSFVQVYTAADKDETQQADAIVVLGAAQFDGTPSPVFQERLDHAYNLWKAGEAPRIITTGSKQEGDRVTEGIAGYIYLLTERGVPDKALVPIVDGGNTWEQLSASSLQIEKLDLGSVLLVSDSYHNYRLLDIADEVGIEAFVSPTAVEPSIGNYMRETIAVSIGRLTGYRRLSSFTSES